MLQLADGRFDIFFNFSARARARPLATSFRGDFKGEFIFTADFAKGDFIRLCFLPSNRAKRMKLRLGNWMLPFWNLKRLGL